MHRNVRSDRTSPSTAGHAAKEGEISPSTLQALGKKRPDQSVEVSKRENLRSPQTVNLGTLHDSDDSFFLHVSNFLGPVNEGWLGKELAKTV
jgi:hypothetical protein